MKATKSGGLADALFTRGQQRVLGILFSQPDRSFPATELISLAGVGTGASWVHSRRLKPKLLAGAAANAR